MLLLQYLENYELDLCFFYSDFFMLAPVLFYTDSSTFLYWIQLFYIGYSTLLIF